MSFELIAAALILGYLSAHWPTGDPFRTRKELAVTLPS